MATKQAVQTSKKVQMQQTLSRETSAESSPVALGGFWANRRVHEKKAAAEPAIEDVMMVSMKRRAKKAKARAEVGNDVRWDLMTTVMLELSVAGSLAPLADAEKQDATPGQKSPAAADTAIRMLKKNKKNTNAGLVKGEEEEDLLDGSTSGGGASTNEEFSDASSEDGWCSDAGWEDAQESLVEEQPPAKPVKKEQPAKRQATEKKQNVNKHFAAYYKRGLLLSYRPKPVTTPPGFKPQGLHARYTTLEEEQALKMATMAPGIEPMQQADKRSTPTAEKLKNAPWRQKGSSPCSSPTNSPTSPTSLVCVPRPPPGLAPPPGL